MTLSRARTREWRRLAAGAFLLATADYLLGLTPWLLLAGACAYVSWRVYHMRLAERLCRADKARSHEMGGAGLGLAIAKHVLVRHDASLDIQSRPGEGSRFSCRFPVHRVLRSQTPAGQEREAVG